MNAMIRDLLLRDWAWKLFSLLLAVAIWLTVHGILEPEEATIIGGPAKLTYENLAVHIVSSETDVSHYHSAPAVVKVTLSGPRNVMDQLQANQVRAEVDLSSSDGSSGQVNIIRPPDVNLVEVDPQTVLVISPPKH
ncbi:MAG: CdaR family protein [Verrucomicrobiota bacterium]|jgi:YbbR domain-containing protein